MFVLKKLDNIHLSALIRIHSSLSLKSMPFLLLLLLLFLLVFLGRIAVEVLLALCVTPLSFMSCDNFLAPSPSPTTCL